MLLSHLFLDDGLAGKSVVRKVLVPVRGGPRLGTLHPLELTVAEILLRHHI